MVTCCYLTVGGAQGIVMLFPACLCVVIVASAVVAKYSFSTFCSHMALFSASEAGWAISGV